MMIMPDSPGRWKTFALAPVSKTVMVHIAFDGPITDDAIKKAMIYLENALDWAPPEVGAVTPSTPLNADQQLKESEDNQQ